jgi:8-oxo-dGTP pyrophosphatase MutT (NUDIX family)/phosphohistidine phosphatase SixA
VTTLRPDASAELPGLPGEDVGQAGVPLPGPAGPPDVLAAGVICWRRQRDGGLEVLLVHRPGHDDWSWPKGKPERRESLPECAVRETAEETGNTVVLGRPLPTVRYPLPDGRTKEASYWAAQAVGQGHPTAPATEIDGTEWVPLELAREQITYPDDLAPLTALAGFADDGTLATSTAMIVRHATARPRDAWARADAERPLVASGRRQAMALAALLQCWRPEYVLSSSCRRCLETLGPYAAVTGTRVRAKGGLTEDGYRRSPEKTHRHTERLLQNTHGGALCTHRPVLEGVMRTLRERSLPEVARELPSTSPYLRPGEVLVAHVTHSTGGPPRIVATEHHGTR